MRTSTGGVKAALRFVLHEMLVVAISVHLTLGVAKVVHAILGLPGIC